jgi:hypothetical protein
LQGKKQWDRKYTRIDWTYEVMPKPNERKFVSWLDPEATEEKPRNLTNPNSLVKWVGGYYNWLILHFMTSHDIGAVYAMNTSEVAKYIRSGLSNHADPVIVSFDGSRHDANQDALKHRLIDIALIKTLMPLFIARNACSPWQIDMLNRMLTTPVHELKAFYPGGDRKTRRMMFRATLHGTTISGHPTFTTFGNTMGVLAYVRFVAHLADV